MKSPPNAYSKDLLLTKPVEHRSLASSGVPEDATYFQSMKQLRSCIAKGIRLTKEEYERVKRADEQQAARDIKALRSTL